METKKQTQHRYLGIKQIGQKQLFMITFHGYELLISYNTVVGICRHSIWYYTDEKYSVTTSRHINQFRKQNGGIVITELELQTILNDLGV